MTKKLVGSLKCTFWREGRNFGKVCSRREHMVLSSFFKGDAVQSEKHRSRN